MQRLRPVRRLVLCGLAGLPLAAAAAPAQQPGILAGTVADSTLGRPLVGAVVTLRSPAAERTTRTDDRGAYVFGRVAEGPHTVHVRMLGYHPAAREVVIPAEGLTADFGLLRVVVLDTVRVAAARQGIYGVVGTLADLRPLPGATVQIIGTSGQGTPVDSSGRFFIPIRAPGTYLVRARAAGYEAQAISVVLRPNEGIEVALLLDSARGRGVDVLAMAMADFDQRLKVRRLASALVPRTELVRHGSTQLDWALRSAPSFGQRGLRFGEYACIFVDGRPRPGLGLNSIDPLDVEVVEVYTARSDASGTLSQRWPRGMPCGVTGLPRTTSQGEVVYWVSIWLKR